MFNQRRLCVRWDISHVQSKEALCESILNKFMEVEPPCIYKIQVVGLYGMGGVGKTTLSKVVCNQMIWDFVGKVCHIEFGNTSSNESETYGQRSLTNNRCSR